MNKQLIISALAVLLCIGISGIVHAKPSAQSGEIELNNEQSSGASKAAGELGIDLKQKKRVRKDPYEVAQDSTIDYFNSVLKKTDALKNGDTQGVRAPLQNEILHLNGLYLYCSIHNGTCPEVLDAILEVDIINSRLSGKASCTIMKKFWKSWIVNKIEKRHQHHVKTGFMNQTTQFKRKVLPRYLRCSQTVQEELDSGKEGSASAFFKARYAKDSIKKDPLEQIVEKLIAMKQHVPDVFKETE